MRHYTTLLQLQALQTCLFLSVQLDGNSSVTLQQGGHMTMACLSGKGHGKKVNEREERGGSGRALLTKPALPSPCDNPTNLKSQTLGLPQLTLYESKQKFFDL